LEGVCCDSNDLLPGRGHLFEDSKFERLRREAKVRILDAGGWQG
jgi:hypothetical protein